MESRLCIQSDSTRASDPARQRRSAEPPAMCDSGIYYRHGGHQVFRCAVGPREDEPAPSCDSPKQGGPGGLRRTSSLAAAQTLQREQALCGHEDTRGPRASDWWSSGAGPKRPSPLHLFVLNGASTAGEFTFTNTWSA